MVFRLRGWCGALTDGSWEANDKHCFATGSAASFPKHVTVDLGRVEKVGAVRFGVPDFGSTRTVIVSTSRDGQAFPDTMIDLVGVGEQTGELPEILLSLSKHFEDRLRLRRRFISSISRTALLRRRTSRAQAAWRAGAFWR